MWTEVGWLSGKYDDDVDHDDDDDDNLKPRIILLCILLNKWVINLKCELQIK